MERTYVKMRKKVNVDKIFNCERKK
jgi:hypothetical protein